MKTFYDKLIDALNQVDGNLLLDPGVQFFTKEIAPYFDTTFCSCKRIVTVKELQINGGICHYCAEHGEVK